MRGSGLLIFTSQEATPPSKRPLKSRIYQALLDKYQLKADECIFIDDRADNIKAASLLGLGTYQMHSVGSLLRSLPTFGVTIH